MKPLLRNNLIPHDLQHPLLLLIHIPSISLPHSKGIPELKLLALACNDNPYRILLLLLALTIDRGSPLEYVGYGETKG